MKTKRIRANLNTRTRWEYVGTPGNYKRVKVTTHRWSLPATADSYEQMVEQFWNRCLREYDAGRSMNQAVRAGFAEIGITKPEQLIP